VLACSGGRLSASLGDHQQFRAIQRSGFCRISLSNGGGLTPIPNSTVNLPGGSSAAPHDIRFSLDGTRLLVSEGGTDHIDVFQVNSRGLLIGVKSQSSAGSGPFGMKFGRDGVLLSAEANSNSVSSYSLTSSDMLTVVSAALADEQQATCWISWPFNNDDLQPAFVYPEADTAADLWFL
jgi:hypothetical protein